MELIFVYGTLRTGFGNNRMLEDSKLIDVARTMEEYAMYDGGVPYVSYGEKVSQIYGELYEVDERTLLAIDMLEGHPVFYNRKKIFVETLKGGVVRAWLYFNETKTDNLIKSGDYAEQRKHARNQI